MGSVKSGVTLLLVVPFSSVKVSLKVRVNDKASKYTICVAVPFNVCNFIKRRLQHRCFRVNIAQFLRTTIMKNIFKRQVLIETALK